LAGVSDPLRTTSGGLFQVAWFSLNNSDQGAWFSLNNGDELACMVFLEGGMVFLE